MPQFSLPSNPQYHYYLEASIESFLYQNPAARDQLDMDLPLQTLPKKAALETVLGLRIKPSPVIIALIGKLSPRSFSWPGTHRSVPHTSV